MRKQPWILGPWFDGIWILGPAFWSTLLVALLPTSDLEGLRAIPLWAWVVLVMCVDVSHVYSTIYRTYLDPEERSRYCTHLLIIPLSCWVIGAVLYSLNTGLFWTCLAYLAVFHFIRQQYGFFMVYRRGEVDTSRFGLLIEKGAIYLATIYPLVFWHSHLPRNFSWFISGDFVLQISRGFENLTFLLYVFVLVLFLCKEFLSFVRSRAINIPKNLILWGTALSWYVGIVTFNADLPFTLTNVVSHGVPYIALIWAFGHKKWAGRSSGLAWVFKTSFVPAFVLILFILGYFEEGIWDGVLWREHLSFFHWAHILGPIHDKYILAVLIPLLAVPQATHYVLDAFIWKIRKPDAGFEKLLGAAG